MTAPLPRPTRVAAPTLRVAGCIGVGLLVGFVSGVLGAAAHLWDATVGGQVLPLGLLLAIGLTCVVDATLLVALPSTTTALADAAGRAVVVGVVLVRGPGGDVGVLGGLPSEIWILLSVLLPAFIGPPLATVAAVRRARRAGPVTLPPPP